jgi:hypothetical protein
MDSEKGKLEGLGDIIKRLTNAVGIKTCSKCEKRRKRMNEMFPNPLKGRDSSRRPDPKPDEGASDGRE